MPSSSGATMGGGGATPLAFVCGRVDGACTGSQRLTPSAAPAVPGRFAGMGGGVDGRVEDGAAEDGAREAASASGSREGERKGAAGEEEGGSTTGWTPFASGGGGPPSPSTSKARLSIWMGGSWGGGEGGRAEPAEGERGGEVTPGILLGEDGCDDGEGEGEGGGERAGGQAVAVDGMGWDGKGARLVTASRRGPRGDRAVGLGGASVSRVEGRGGAGGKNGAPAGWAGGRAGSSTDPGGVRAARRRAAFAPPGGRGCGCGAQRLPRRGAVQWLCPQPPLPPPGWRVSRWRPIYPQTHRSPLRQPITRLRAGPGPAARHGQRDTYPIDIDIGPRQGLGSRSGSGSGSGLPSPAAGPRCIYAYPHGKAANAESRPTPKPSFSALSAPLAAVLTTVDAPLGLAPGRRGRQDDALPHHRRRTLAHLDLTIPISVLLAKYSAPLRSSKREKGVRSLSDKLLLIILSHARPRTAPSVQRIPGAAYDSWWLYGGFSASPHRLSAKFPPRYNGMTDSADRIGRIGSGRRPSAPRGCGWGVEEGDDARVWIWAGPAPAPSRAEMSWGWLFGRPAYYLARALDYPDGTGLDVGRERGEKHTLKPLLRSASWMSLGGLWLLARWPIEVVPDIVVVWVRNPWPSTAAHASASLLIFILLCSICPAQAMHRSRHGAFEALELHEESSSVPCWETRKKKKITQPSIKEGLSSGKHPVDRGSLMILHLHSTAVSILPAALEYGRNLW
ncbi:hypothetical protein CALCODRAFT_505475 [Calocera cornea HHB12733]|uniref:Uncharacterized protein n=1 Tax=Calocera cornea HHB12733 TaxID=1353952 RepID=A0A165K5S9_9BASI|nr:hypothetical protein CALCODRAFT_505475 [Calocera cornea HHB12733]